MPATRQLAAIMFTDIVGYTALMGEDEQKAFQILSKNRDLQKPLIEQYGGKWVKEMGDGVLATFTTVTDAVSCACRIIKACDEVEGLQLRIGIHLGDVVFENHDVFGDGVNIASRLQALAPIGGIWISEAVYKNVSNKKEINTKFVREEELKHVKEPVRIYEIIPGDEATILLEQPPAAKQTSLAKKPYSANTKNRLRLFLTGSIVLLLGVVALGYWFYSGQKTKQIQSIAVMPFINESRNTDIEYLSDGITETLISSLAQLPDLDVKARSSVFRYKGKDAEPQTVGKELNVRAVLNGTVIPRGQDLALHIELVDAQKETVLWSADYKQPLANLISLQSEITRDVVQKLKIRLSAPQAEKLAKSYTVNSEAYELYLKGRYYWNKRTAKDVDKSLDYYQQAIGIDPNYALAYAGLADSYTVPMGGTPSREKMVKGREAAKKALSLDDKLAEAHTAYARVLTVYDYDFTAAVTECRRAIELNPNYAATYDRYSFVLLKQGRFEEALTQIRWALKIEPLNLNFNTTYGLVMMFARRYDEAIGQFKKIVDLDANFVEAYNFLYHAHRLKGNYAESVEARAKAFEVDGDARKAAQVRESFERGGWQGFLRFMAEEPITPSTRFYSLAHIYVALGEKDRALAALNQAYENRESLIALLNVDPRLDPLRKDPRFQELVRRVDFK